MTAKHNIQIRRETPADYRAVEELTREAFWNVYRPGCSEHYVVHCLRDRPEFVPELDLVMERNGELIGHILYVRAEIQADDGRRIPVMAFGPISIRPDCQRQGLGKALLDESLERARALAGEWKDDMLDLAQRMIRCPSLSGQEGPVSEILLAELIHS